MSQQPRSRPVDPPAAADALTTPAAASVASPPSNAPTIFLLVMVIGMMVFIAWWAFLGKDARANANAILPPLPRLDAVPARPKRATTPVPAATPVPDAAAAVAAAPNEAAPVISEVPNAMPERQKPAKGGAASTDAD